MKTCRYCPNEIRAKGLCQTHYARMNRTGSPHVDRPQIKGTPNDKGLGVIACAICDRPVRDHRIGRCPEWEKAL